MALQGIVILPSSDIKRSKLHQKNMPFSSSLSRGQFCSKGAHESVQVSALCKSPRIPIGAWGILV